MSFESIKRIEAYIKVQIEDKEEAKAKLDSELDVLYSALAFVGHEIEKELMNELNDDDVESKTATD